MKNLDWITSESAVIAACDCSLVRPVSSNLFANWYLSK